MSHSVATVVCKPTLTFARQVFSIIIVICIATPIFLAALVPMGIFYYYAQIYYGECLLVVCQCSIYSVLQLPHRAS